MGKHPAERGDFVGVRKARDSLPAVLVTMSSAACVETRSRCNENIERTETDWVLTRLLGSLEQPIQNQGSVP